MSKAKEISNGYKNLLLSKLGLSSEENEKVFNARREICNSCASRDILLDRCKLCGCPLAAKTRSIVTECPIKLW
tara:strand:+ start:8820 stop:9041 length:222 start_codon:yes stop_codon:yes gene_type:complete